MDAVAVRESCGSFLVDRSTMRFGLIALFLVSFKILTRRKPLLRSVAFNLEESAEVKKWVGKSVVLRSSNESGVVIGYSDHLKRFDVSVAPLSRRVFVDEADLVLDKKSERLQSHGMKLGQVIYNKKRCGIVSDYKDIEGLGGAYLITDEDGSQSKLFDKHTKTQQWFIERLTNEIFSSHGIFVDAKGNDLIDLLRRQLSMDNRHAAFLQFVSVKEDKLAAAVSVILDRYPDQVIEAIMTRPILNSSLLQPISVAIDDYIKELVQKRASEMTGNIVQITARRFAGLGIVGTVQNRVASKHRFVIRSDHPRIGSMRLFKGEFETAKLAQGARVITTNPQDGTLRGTVLGLCDDTVQVKVDDTDEVHCIPRECLKVIGYTSPLATKIERTWSCRRVMIQESGLLWEKTGRVKRCRPEDIGMCTVVIDSFFEEELCVDMDRLTLI